MANCYYCGRWFQKKSAAVEHIQNAHGDELAKDGLDASQALYLTTHPTLHGKCMCGCNTPTEWNYKTGKPYKVSPDPKCRERLNKIAQANLMHARGIDQHTLMSDMEHQREMQKNRKLTKFYKFKDGGSVEYMGQLDLNWLKFCDTVMDFTSNMIQEPPENIPYYDPKVGVTRMYMPDHYLPDYNLIVEIKDGGDHPNTNPAFVKETKYKVALKDDAMRKQTKYNYIRISGRNYGPFLEALYTIVHEQNNTEKDDKQKVPVIVITESACMEPLEEIDLSQEEQIDATRIRLMIGYLGGTNQPIYVAVTDSKQQAYWYVTDLIDLNTTYRYWEEAIFRQTGTTYKIFSYVGPSEPMQEAYRLVMDAAMKHALHKESELWDITQIFRECGVMFDDGHYVNTNNERKSMFILREHGKIPEKGAESE